MKKTNFTPASAPVSPVVSAQNHPDQPQETPATGQFSTEYAEPVHVEAAILPEVASTTEPEPAQNEEAAHLLQVLAEAEQTEPVTEPAPEPAPAPKPTKAELLADRAQKLKELNLITEQLEKLQRTSDSLENFTYNVDGDDDHRYASVQIVDDRSNRWTTQNANLCALLTAYLKQLIAEKVGQKEAELLSIQL